MADVLKIACPNCEKAMAVPATMAGKKIKCKGCDTTFTVRDGGYDPDAGTMKFADDDAKPKPAKKATPKKAVAKPAAAPTAAGGPTQSPAARKAAEEWDDDGNPYVVTHDDFDVPRCPFCAVELDPPDTKVCMECGFNMLERRRHESKKVYELTAADYLKYHIVTFLCFLAGSLLIALCVVCWIKMDDWFHGPLDFIEMDDLNENTGKKKTYLPPGACNVFIIVPSLFLIYKSMKVVFVRLVFKFKPPETIKKSG